MIEVFCGDNLEVLPGLPAGRFDLIYIDPPFNTGRTQPPDGSWRRRAMPSGDRTGFQGERYRTTRLGTRSYADAFDDYLGFLEPRLREAHRSLAPDGSPLRAPRLSRGALRQGAARPDLRARVLPERDHLGVRLRRPRHEALAGQARQHPLVHPAPDRLHLPPATKPTAFPYMAPGLVGPEKAARGKTPTDTWWHTIVSPTGKEKTGYPTQKPLGILERIVKVHSSPGMQLCDFFAGSGSFGDAADRHRPRRGPDRQQSRGDRRHAHDALPIATSACPLLLPGQPDDSHFRRGHRAPPRHARRTRRPAPRSALRRGDAADLPDVDLRAGRPRPAAQRLRIRPHPQPDARSVGRQPRGARRRQRTASPSRRGSRRSTPRSSCSRPAIMSWSATTSTAAVIGRWSGSTSDSG